MTYEMRSLRATCRCRSRWISDARVVSHRQFPRSRAKVTLGGNRIPEIPELGPDRFQLDVDLHRLVAQEQIDIGRDGTNEIERDLDVGIFGRRRNAFAVRGHDAGRPAAQEADRKSTRLNSSHLVISYAV